MERLITNTFDLIFNDVEYTYTIYGVIARPRCLTRYLSISYPKGMTFNQYGSIFP